MITNSYTENHYYESSMFDYLTPNAIVYCDRLIRMLADSLLKEIDSDREKLTFEVIVR
jgi:hypothetical protein